MGRPTVPTDIRTLIRDMSNANPRWGAPRIHGELLKLGIDVCQASCYTNLPSPPRQLRRISSPLLRLPSDPIDRARAVLQRSICGPDASR